MSDAIRVRIPPQVKTWIRRVAIRQNIDMSDVVRQILAEKYNQRRTA